jgi:hypothetical protein
MALLYPTAQFVRFSQSQGHIIPRLWSVLSRVVPAGTQGAMSPHATRRWAATKKLQSSRSWQEQQDQEQACGSSRAQLLCIHRVKVRLKSQANPAAYIQLDNNYTDQTNLFFKLVSSATVPSLAIAIARAVLLISESPYEGIVECTWFVLFHPAVASRPPGTGSEPHRNRTTADWQEACFAALRA